MPEVSGEYGFGQWAGSSNSKDISSNDVHNPDITISFSKAKNQQNNMFHEDPEIRKSCLKQVLEYGDE